MKCSLLTLVVLCLLMVIGHTVDYQLISDSGHHFIVCRVDLDKESLSLFLRDQQGNPYLGFSALNQDLAKYDQRLIFAMNAGMYEPDYSPVGLFVATGVVLSPLNLNHGTGNFYLRPNGVFYVDDAGGHILDSFAYAQVNPHALLATQSGPLLVRQDKINPLFVANGTSRLKRNGVGISSNRHILFVISEDPVSFYEMASFFRRELRCSDALYFDGNISSLYAPHLHRQDSQTPLGPMIGVMEKKPLLR